MIKQDHCSCGYRIEGRTLYYGTPAIFFTEHKHYPIILN
jgi:hypothetical protein